MKVDGAVYGGVGRGDMLRVVVFRNIMAAVHFLLEINTSTWL